ncbi:uncharacterized protein [Macrobrachium rosenbergii]|uniref:uncharacterized protein isoform X2 n=1 Tax=Macrobrachium rosenbergii TaxID=79674 RepID=UPI0034D51A5B
MQRLFLLGYRWSHTYTQCVLQELLHAIRHKVDFDLSSCNGDVDQDLEGALRAIEGEELVDPRDLAIVRFTPSATDPHSDFADEVYFPPIKDHESEDHQDDDDQTEAGDHQESPTSEPGESSSGGTGGGGNSAGDSNGSSSSSSSPNFHPLGGIDTFPANPPGPPMSDAAVSAPSSFRDHPPPPRPPYDPRQQNYIRVYDPSDMDEYDDHYDDDDDSTSYRSPYHYQTPLNPVYRKRSRPVEEAPVFSGEKMTMSQLRRIANMLDNFRLQKNDLEDREDLEEGVFGESPTRPMYSEAGLQFIPEVGDDDDPMETAAREAILSNMPQDLHVVQDGFRSMPDEFRNVPGVLDTFSPGNGRRYLNSLRNLPDAIRNIPEGLDVIPLGYNSIPAAPQDYRGQEPVAMENSIPRSFYMPDVGPVEVGKDDLPWNRLMLEEEEEEDEDDLQNSLPRSNNKNTALQEAFGPQLNAIRDFEEGNDFNDYQDYREGLLDEYGDYGQYDVLDQAFPFLQKFDKKDEERAGDDDDMAQDRDWSFKRPERLDVKKPGPGFGVNNFAFRDAYSQDGDSGQLDLAAAEIPSLLGEGPLLPSRLMSKNSVDLSRDAPDDTPGEVAEMLGDFALRETNQEIPDVLLADEGIVEEATDEVVSAPKAEKLQEKKEQVNGASPAAPTETPAKELEKPNSYVHISTAEKLKTEKEGADLARYIVRLSGLTAAHLQNLKVGEDRVMFRIGENAKGITASDVAKKAEELRDQVKAKTGQTISQAGIGDETTMLALVQLQQEAHRGCCSHRLWRHGCSSGGGVRPVFPEEERQIQG